MNNDISIKSTDNYDVSVETCEKISVVKKDGTKIVYKPSFESDGIKFPIVIGCEDVEYLLIPKKVLKEMLLEYLPEILKELKQQ